MEYSKYNNNRNIYKDVILYYSMKNKPTFLLGYRNPAIKLYTPKVNRTKQASLIGLAVICLVTPFTNWTLPLTIKLITKFNPLWIYR